MWTALLRESLRVEGLGFCHCGTAPARGPVQAARQQTLSQQGLSGMRCSVQHCQRQYRGLGFPP